MSTDASFLVVFAMRHLTTISREPVYASELSFPVYAGRQYLSFFIKSEKSVPDFNLLKLFQKLELQAYCPSVIVFLRFYFLLLFCSILSAI